MQNSVNMIELYLNLIIKVLTQYSQIIGPDDLALTCCMIASLYILKKDYLKAMEEYKKVIDEYPDSKWVDQARWWFQKLQKYVH